MRKIKILAIAPYLGLKDLLIEVASEREELEIHAFVGDMVDGVRIAESIIDEDFDFVLSRAGTAELIEEVTDLPVIDIKLSVIDMMRAIKLAQGYSGRFGIVGFKSITETAEIIGQLNNYSMEIKTVYAMNEIEDRLNDLKENGVSLIVGDVITCSHAKKIGLNTILVTSGKESVINSFADIISLDQQLSNLKHKSMLTNSIIQHSNEDVLSFNTEKEIIYSKLKESDEIKSLIIKKLTGYIDTLRSEKELTIIENFENNLFLITGRELSLKMDFYPTFFIKKLKSTLKPIDKSIIYKNALSSPQINFNALTTSSKLFKKVISDAKAYSKTNTPIIIYGEKGTGKDTLAQAIYQNSNYKNSPLVVINSNYMNEAKWISIFESESSPFLKNDITIYFRNLHFLNTESLQLIESYLSNTHVHRRIRLIFSSISGYSKSLDNSRLMQFIRNDLAAFSLILPTLNERKEDIPSLVSIFLSELIPKYGKQVLGFEPEAINILQNFNWKFNMDQLKRVVEEAFVLTHDYYVDAKTTDKVLANNNFIDSENHHSLYDSNKTLDQINNEIIERVLIEENFNQTKAAERLGISRSTLWRKIK